jgi:hypothetical protein
MADIKDTVGPGTGTVHDISLIQAMLKVIKDKNNDPYLGSNYDGKYGKDTKKAIVAFQNDLKIADKPGFVEKNSATLKQLNASLPPDYADMRIIEKTSTVYLAADVKALNASLNQLAAAELDPIFRMNIIALVGTMYDRHKIVISCPDSGMRRDFAWQMVMNNRGAGPAPGESNHQYGKAVDIGFGGLRWVDGNGKIRTDTFWLNGGEDAAAKKAAFMTPAKQSEFWRARDAIAHDELKLHKTSRAGDIIHIQAYSDDFVDYGRSLAKLLTTVGKMNWEFAGGPPRKFRTDFGLGGKFYGPYTGKSVWTSAAVVNPTDVAAALQASAKNLAQVAPWKDFVFVKKALQALQKSKAPLPHVVKGGAAKATDITPADIALLLKALKADYEVADKNWKQWAPVP